MGHTNWLEMGLYAARDYRKSWSNRSSIRLPRRPVDEGVLLSAKATAASERSFLDPSDTLQHKATHDTNRCRSGSRGTCATPALFVCHRERGKRLPRRDVMFAISGEHTMNACECRLLPFAVPHCKRRSRSAALAEVRSADPEV